MRDEISDAALDMSAFGGQTGHLPLDQRITGFGANRPTRDGQRVSALPANIRCQLVPLARRRPRFRDIGPCSRS